MFKKGDEIIVDVVDLSSEGKGISKVENGFVIFSKDTLPGDKALIKITKKKHNYAEAKLNEIIEPSHYRVEPICQYFGVCGGCKIQNYDYIQQIVYKTKIVKDAFERIGGFMNLNIPEALKSNDIFFYRNKMEFSFSDDKWLDNPLKNNEGISMQEKNESKFDKQWLKDRGLVLGGYHLPYNPKLVERAREFRKNLTEAEKKLWYQFLNNHEERFLRQRPIDNYIADFYCAAAKLVIELDGRQHLENNSKLYDEERATFLEEIYGLKVIRFTNKDVINNFKNVCNKLDKIIKERKRFIPPNPPLQGGKSKDDFIVDSSLQGGENKDDITFDSLCQGTKNREAVVFNPPYKGGQGGLALGLHVPKFHSKIIDIHECFLQSKLSNEILNFTREFFKDRNISVYSSREQTGLLRFLIIRQSKNTEEMMVNIITFDYDKKLMNEYAAKLKYNFHEITSIINSISQNKAQVALGEKEYVLYGKGFITESLKTHNGRKYTFNISPQSFFQTNTLQAEKLFNTLVSLSNFNVSDNVLDLYCGIGSISIFISNLVNKVLGVELNEDSINNANTNAKINNVKNVNFINSDIKDFLENYNSLSEYSKVILDPPRSGLHPKICEILSETKFERIMYVSCNPHTQARDLSVICGKGNYEIEKIQPVDMFPHTYHIENIVALKGIV